jgi:hypothetical protein
MPQAGFEPAIPANQRPQTHVLDRAATGIGTVDLPNTGFEFVPLNSEKFMILY